ncbi:MAG: FAD-dependent monooxygenase [Acidimicrobiales bacterium]
MQVDRVTSHRFRSIATDRFSSGPVFLAGVAAHRMPPFNGQGMCSGMNDAENLAWKFPPVAHGIATPDLLAISAAELRFLHRGQRLDVAHPPRRTH